MQLRPHQEQAVKAMLRNTKGQVIVPVSYTHLRANETKANDE